MNVRSNVAVLTVAASAVLGTAGAATAANSPTNVPGPCTDPVSMPEYCDPTGGTGGGDPEPKPGSDLTDLTNGDRDDDLEAEHVDTWSRSDSLAPAEPTTQTREHILLARQVGLAPTPRITFVPTGAEYVDSWSSSDG